MRRTSTVGQEAQKRKPTRDHEPGTRARLKTSPGLGCAVRCPEEGSEVRTNPLRYFVGERKGFLQEWSFPRRRAGSSIQQRRRRPGPAVASALSKKAVNARPEPA